MCAPAVALIFSSKGEVEIFSNDNRCNKKIVEFPHFGGEGRSIDLLDDQLVLLGDNKIGGKFEYISIHRPRKGLLGMKFSVDLSLVGNGPHWHTSHSYGNEILAIGGYHQSKARLSNTVWNGLNLHWQNGSSFSRFSSGACKVKLSREVFLLIGGFERVKGSRVALNLMLRLNTTQETVEEMPPIKMSRAFHACEVFNEKILISGGNQGENAIADEVYSLTTNTSSLLSMDSSLTRQQHQLLRLGETIFALGGILSNGSKTALVEWFDWSVMKWKHHGQALVSEGTAHLSVTAFPLTAVDCHAGCSCGLVNNKGNSRIVGGTETQVDEEQALTYHQSYHHSCRKTLIPGL